MERIPLLPALAGAALVLAAAVVAAPQTSRPDGEPGATVTSADRTALRELIDRLGKNRSAYEPATDQRWLIMPEGQIANVKKWRPLVGDPEVARLETLAGRAAGRAYDGAPPVMPHSRNFIKTRTCLDCHGTGIWLGKRFGPPLSHPDLLNCMQCHVESENLDLEFTGRVDNSFDGLMAPVGGSRAWNGAPPVIPHTTLMRTRCLSCHGPQSYPGLRTDHAQRINCVQCHAQATSLDQTSPFFTGNATLLRDLDVEEPDALEP